MSGRMLAGRFRRQPQYAAPIDRANPLTAGLAWVFNGATPSNNHVNGAGAAGIVGSGLTRLTGPAGRAVQALGTAGCQYWTGHEVGAVYTAAVLLRNTANDPDTLPLNSFDFASNNVFFLRLQTGFPSLRVYNNAGGNANPNSASVDIGTTAPTLLVGTLDAAQLATLYINGRYDDAATLTGTPQTITAARKIAIANDATSSSFTFNGELFMAAIWNRALSAAEVAALYANPWQLFRYPGRPSADMATGGAGAVLDAAGTNVATGSGALSTQIPVAAAGLVVATGSAALTAAIRLALAGANVATGTADLSTTPAGLAAAGGNVATGSAAIVTGIPLGAAAVSVASGNGTITTSITLTAAGVVAALGSALLGTNIRLNAAGQIASTGTAGLSTNVLMGAVGAALATGTAQITVQIQLNGAGFAVATGTASLTAPGSGLAASGAAIATATANLSGAIPLIASGAALGTGSGALQTAIRVAAAGADVVTGTASLTLPIALAAAGVSAGNGNGTLSTSITLSAQGWAQVIGAGGITTVIRLAAAGVSQAVGSGLLSGFLYVPTPRSHSLRMGAVARSMRLPPQRRSCRLPPINRTLSRITMGAT